MNTLKLYFVIFVSIISAPYSAVEGYLYVEGTVEKVERKWSSNPLTGLPQRITPALWLKISKVNGLKSTPIENDTWESEFGSVIGKGFRLDPIPDNSVTNPKIKKVMEQLRAEKGKQRIVYMGSSEAVKFMVRASKIWNSWKGDLKIRAVIDVQAWQTDGINKLSFHVNPAEISQADKVHREKNYREFWTNPQTSTKNFKKLYSSD